MNPASEKHFLWLLTFILLSLSLHRSLNSQPAGFTGHMPRFYMAGFGSLVFTSMLCLWKICLPDAVALFTGQPGADAVFVIRLSSPDRFKRDTR